MRRLLLASCSALLLTVATAQAQVLGTLNITANGQSACWEVLNTPSLTLTVSGTWVGTLEPRASEAPNAAPAAIGHAVDDSDGSATASLTTNARLAVQNYGYQRICLVSTAWTSGTAVITATRGQGISSSSTAEITGEVTVGSIDVASSPGTGSTAASVPATANYTGLNIGGNLVGLSGLTVGSTNAGAVAIVDSSGNQISSFGGGTQYGNADANADPTGTVALGYDGSNVRALATNSSGNLQVVFAATPTVTVQDGGSSLTVDGTVAATQSGTWNIGSITTLPSLPAGANVIGGVTQSGTWNIGSITTLPALATGSNVIGGVTQSGTWTVQPGNTANTTPWLVTISEGGVAADVNASGQLAVTCANCSGTGVSVNEDAASSDGDAGTPAYAIREDSLSTSTSATGDYQPLKSDSVGRLYTNIFGITQAAATYLTVRLSDGTNYLTPGMDYAEDDAHTSGDTGPVLLTRRIDAPATSADTSGDYAVANTNASGALWTSSVDPCDSEAKSRTAISATADMVLISAAASKKNYICSIVLVAGAAEIVNIVEGTGTTCGTSTAAIVGSTTEANGMSFAANSGFSAVGGNATVIPGSGTNVDTCLLVSGSNRVSGFVTWVQR